MKGVHGWRFALQMGGLSHWQRHAEVLNSFELKLWMLNSEPGTRGWKFTSWQKANTPLLTNHATTGAMATAQAL